MSFLNIENKTFLVFGVANKKSVAYGIAKTLEEEGAKVIYSVRSPQRKEQLEAKLLKDREIHICDFESQEDIDGLAKSIQDAGVTLYGFVHSVAFANYSEGLKPFHQTVRKDFLQAVDISCYSLIALTNALTPVLSKNASIVTISISTTRMASENYGYMGPVKAALDSAVAFLNKSLSETSNIRVNAVGASLLKTSASAGIPNYVNSYLFAEKVIPRKEALKTKEAADTAIFLLSERSSGIVAQTIIVDAGMSINYFDKNIINKVME
ncbi:MAG: SDR family oxidoreductase [Lentisphaeraceae bacterium]|nr:SDR family oxidoreductase [Lentisphaeraceae bacterium]